MNHARLNNLIQFQQPMSDPTNEPSREPIRKPTNNRMEINKVKSNKREPIASHSSIKQDKSTPTFQLVVASVSNKREPIASHSSIKYLRTSQVPPFWAELVCASSKLHVYTERQIDTWQSLPELTPEIGDFTSDHAVIPNVLGTPISDVSSLPLKPSLKASKGVNHASSTSDHTSASRVVSFQDQKISQSDHPQPNEWAMPESVDLHSS